jgi:hypothetical protein
VPPNALVDAYFALQIARNLLLQPTAAQGMLTMYLSNLCPIALAWATYFMDFKTPYEALEMRRKLVATLANAADQTRASPILDWLRAACVHLGPNAANRCLSLVNQGFEPTAPGARVIMWMLDKVSHNQKMVLHDLPLAGVGAVAGAPIPPKVH